MRRRSLLASLAAGSAAVAGCASRPGSDATGSTRRTTTPGTTEDPSPDGGDSTTNDDEPDDDGDPEWSPDTAVVELATQPRTLSLFPTEYESPDGGRVTLAFAETATADGPARVRARLSNANDFSNVFRLPRHPPFGATPNFYPEPDDDAHPAALPEDAGRVYLAPLPDQSVPTTAPSFHRDSNGYWRLDAAPEGRWLPETKRLDAGESVTVEFAVVSAPGSNTRIPAGRHERGIPGDDALTLAAWHTNEPGPTAESRFAGESFPALPGDDETGESAVAWFHEADASQSVFLRPTAESTTLPKTIAFHLVNHDTEPATGNPYYWSLYKLVDGAWQKLEPQAYPLPMAAVPPGDAKTYRLRAANGDALPCSDGITSGYLGGGTYAFEVGMSVEGRRHAAVFELDADPIDLATDESLTVEHDGDTVTATDDRWRDDSGRGVVTVRRADTAGDTVDRTVSPELAARRHYFRNTLPLFAAGVETVRLRTSDGVARAVTDLGTIASRSDAFAFEGEIKSR